MPARFEHYIFVLMIIHYDLCGCMFLFVFSVFVDHKRNEMKNIVRLNNRVLDAQNSIIFNFIVVSIVLIVYLDLQVRDY